MIPKSPARRHVVRGVSRSLCRRLRGPAFRAAWRGGSVGVLLGAVTLLVLFAVAPTYTKEGSPSLTSAQSPLTDDPLGPLENVTSDWTYYQPAADFCITPDVLEVPGFTPSTCDVSVGGGAPGSGATAAGETPTTGTYEVKIDTPPLCSTCVRVFVDYAKIAADAGTDMTSNGHAYFKLMSLNQTYTSDPVAHSPNIKNFTNDYLIAPPGSTSSTVTQQVDTYLLTFAADTANYAHDDAQGPYYVGPGYYNTAGNWIDGAYVDIDLANSRELGSALDPVVYGAAFDTNPPSCIDSELGGTEYADGNYFYGGCVNWAGGSAAGINPWPDGE